MKQYRYTSADFVTPGDTGDADAVMDADDLRDLRRLAGLNEDLANLASIDSDNVAKIPNNANVNTTSPVGSNPSTGAMEKRKKEREAGIRPGDPEWFKLWFGREE